MGGVAPASPGIPDGHAHAPSSESPTMDAMKKHQHLTERRLADAWAELQSYSDQGNPLEAGDDGLMILGADLYNQLTDVLTHLNS